MIDGKVVKTKSIGIAAGIAKKNSTQTIRDKNGKALITMKGVGSFTVGNNLAAR